MSARIKFSQSNRGMSGVYPRAQLTGCCWCKLHWHDALVDPIADLNASASAKVPRSSPRFRRCRNQTAPDSQLRTARKEMPACTKHQEVRLVDTSSTCPLPASPQHVFVQQCRHAKLTNDDVEEIVRDRAVCTAAQAEVLLPQPCLLLL